MPKFTTDTFKRVYNDKTGEHVQVGPDRDGLALCEIIQGTSSIVMMPEEARLVALAILELYPEPKTTGEQVWTPDGREAGRP